MSDSPQAKRKCPEQVIDPNAKEGILKFTFNNISKMEIRNTQYFPVQHLGGFPWKLAACRRTIAAKNEGEVEYLALFVGILNHDANLWFCEYDVTFTVVNQENSANSIKEILANKRYSQDDLYLQGTAQFCKWDAITDPTKGFIKDDSIKVEAAIQIKSATGKSFRSKSSYDFFSGSETSDVVLTVESKDFHVSKQLLAVQSSYFHALFFNKYKERDQEKIPLLDISAKDFENLLRVVYRIDLIVRDDELEGILRIADMYDIKGVMDEAEKWLLSAKKLTLERKLMYADRHRLQVLQDQCLKKVTKCDQIMALRRCDEYKLYSSDFKVILFDMFADFSIYK